MLPVVVAPVPVIFPHRVVIAAVVLGAFALIGTHSIGLFYVPAAGRWWWLGSMRGTGCAIG